MTEFEKIYRTYFDDVYRYILKLSSDKKLAEDITSETFFKAMRSIHGFRGDCSIRVWLCQIAKNCYFTYLKKAGRIQQFDDMELLQLFSGEESTEEQIVKKDEAERIRMVLHEMPEPYKEVFMWRVFGELNFKQIGQMFGKTENWACVTYHRAKNMIQSKVEDK